MSSYKLRNKDYESIYARCNCEEQATPDTTPGKLKKKKKGLFGDILSLTTFYCWMFTPVKNIKNTEMAIKMAKKY